MPSSLFAMRCVHDGNASNTDAMRRVPTAALMVPLRFGHVANQHLFHAGRLLQQYMATQAARIDLFRFDRLFIRWMLTSGLSYEQARSRFAPFDRLAAPDVKNRDRVAGLVEAYARQHKPALVIVNNKAEGSAPLSIFKLAERLLAQ